MRDGWCVAVSNQTQANADRGDFHELAYRRNTRRCNGGIHFFLRSVFCAPKPFLWPEEGKILGPAVDLVCWRAVAVNGYALQGGELAGPLRSQVRACRVTEILLPSLGGKCADKSLPERVADVARLIVRSDVGTRQMSNSPSPARKA